MTLFFLNISTFCLFGKKIAISLGMRCDPALYMRKNFNIRKNAYPFDWLVSPFDALYRCFEDDFLHFLQADSLTIKSLAVIDYYGFEYSHDFPTTNNAFIENVEEGWTDQGSVVPNYLDYLEAIQEKYQRRIKRLRNALSGSDEIFLIRLTITKQQAKLLYDLIQSRYTKLNFTLVAVNNYKEQPWRIQGIKNFYVPAGPNFHQEWKAVFSAFGLI